MPSPAIMHVFIPIIYMYIIVAIVTVMTDPQALRCLRWLIHVVLFI